MREQSIPRFITARTAEDLQVEMVNVQASMGMFFQFFDIQFVKGKWYAWFKIPLTRVKDLDAIK